MSLKANQSQICKFDHMVVSPVVRKCRTAITGSSDNPFSAQAPLGVVSSSPIKSASAKTSSRYARYQTTACSPTHPQEVAQSPPSLHSAVSCVSISESPRKSVTAQQPPKNNRSSVKSQVQEKSLRELLLLDSKPPGSLKASTKLPSAATAPSRPLRPVPKPSSVVAIRKLPSSSIAKSRSLGTSKISSKSLPKVVGPGIDIKSTGQPSTTAAATAKKSGPSSLRSSLTRTSTSTTASHHSTLSSRSSLNQTTLHARASSIAEATARSKTSSLSLDTKKSTNSQPPTGAPPSRSLVKHVAGPNRFNRADKNNNIAISVTSSSPRVNPQARATKTPTTSPVVSPSPAPVVSPSPAGVAPVVSPAVPPSRLRLAQRTAPPWKKTSSPSVVSPSPDVKPKTIVAVRETRASFARRVANLKIGAQAGVEEAVCVPVAATRQLPTRRLRQNENGAPSAFLRVPRSKETSPPLPEQQLLPELKPTTEPQLAPIRDTTIWRGSFGPESGSPQRELNEESVGACGATSVACGENFIAIDIPSGLKTAESSFGGSAAIKSVSPHHSSVPLFSLALGGGPTEKFLVPGLTESFVSDQSSLFGNHDCSDISFEAQVTCEFCVPKGHPQVVQAVSPSPTPTSYDSSGGSTFTFPSDAISMLLQPDLSDQQSNDKNNRVSVFSFGAPTPHQPRLSQTGPSPSIPSPSIPSPSVPSPSVPSPSVPSRSVPSRSVPSRAVDSLIKISVPVLPRAYPNASGTPQLIAPIKRRPLREQVTPPVIESRAILASETRETPPVIASETPAVILASSETPAFSFGCRTSNTVATALLESNPPHFGGTSSSSSPRSKQKRDLRPSVDLSAAAALYAVLPNTRDTPFFVEPSPSLISHSSASGGGETALFASPASRLADLNSSAIGRGGALLGVNNSNDHLFSSSGQSQTPSVRTCDFVTARQQATTTSSMGKLDLGQALLDAKIRPAQTLQSMIWENPMRSVTRIVSDMFPISGSRDGSLHSARFERRGNQPSHPMVCCDGTKRGTGELFDLKTPIVAIDTSEGLDSATNKACDLSLGESRKETPRKTVVRNSSLASLSPPRPFSSRPFVLIQTAEKRRVRGRSLPCVAGRRGGEGDTDTSFVCVQRSRRLSEKRGELITSELGQRLAGGKVIGVFETCEDLKKCASERELSEVQGIPEWSKRNLSRALCEEEDARESQKKTDAGDEQQDVCVSGVCVSGSNKVVRVTHELKKMADAKFIGTSTLGEVVGSRQTETPLLSKRESKKNDAPSDEDEVDDDVGTRRNESAGTPIKMIVANYGRKEKETTSGAMDVVNRDRDRETVPVHYQPIRASAMMMESARQISELPNFGSEQEDHTRVDNECLNKSTLSLSCGVTPRLRPSFTILKRHRSGHHRELDDRSSSSQSRRGGAKGSEPYEVAISPFSSAVNAERAKTANNSNNDPGRETDLRRATEAFRRAWTDGVVAGEITAERGTYSRSQTPQVVRSEEYVPVCERVEKLNELIAIRGNHLRTRSEMVPSTKKEMERKEFGGNGGVSVRPRTSLSAVREQRRVGRPMVVSACENHPGGDTRDSSKCYGEENRPVVVNRAEGHASNQTEKSQSEIIITQSTQDRFEGGDEFKLLKARSSAASESDNLKANNNPKSVSNSGKPDSTWAGRAQQIAKIRKSLEGFRKGYKMVFDSNPNTTTTSNK